MTLHRLVSGRYASVRGALVGEPRIMIATILENLGRIVFARNVLRATRDNLIHGEIDGVAEICLQVTQFPVGFPSGSRGLKQ